jgi:hypothetical protein
MRNPLILLAPLLLAGCVDGAASYYIDGKDHTLTVRAEQQRFWNDEVTLRLIASRLPDCQRQLVLGKLPAGELELELFANGDNVYTLRAGERQWRVETLGCTQLAVPVQAPAGRPLGVFRLDGENKLVFDKAAATVADAVTDAVASPTADAPAGAAADAAE